MSRLSHLFAVGSVVRCDVEVSEAVWSRGNASLWISPMVSDFGLFSRLVGTVLLYLCKFRASLTACSSLGELRFGHGELWKSWWEYKAGTGNVAPPSPGSVFIMCVSLLCVGYSFDQSTFG